LTAQRFYENRFCSCIINGVTTGWHVKICWHFTDIASKSDGNFLQSVIVNKTHSSTSFLHTTLRGTYNFILLLGGDVAQNWHTTVSESIQMTIFMYKCCRFNFLSFPPSDDCLGRHCVILHFTVVWLICIFN
jgi:hypothetical protein